jgi:hypothetical protein
MNENEQNSDGEPPCLVPCWPICCDDCPFGELGDDAP